MTQTYELYPIPWEDGWYRVVCDPYRDGKITSVGKVGRYDGCAGWVTVNCGDMLYPNDDASFPTPREAAEALTMAYSGRGWYRQCDNCGNQLTELEMILTSLCSKCVGEVPQ